MPWVMLPVPEELAEQVESLLFQLKFRDATVQWTPLLMGDHLQSLAEEPRVALLAVAKGVLAAKPIEDVELGEILRIGAREVFAVVRDANDVTVAALSSDLIGVRQENEDDGAGGTRARRVLHMLPLHAEMIRDQAAARGMRLPARPAG